MKSLILGHRGMVGAALKRILPDAESWNGAKHDYRSQELAEATIQHFSPDILYLCVARVGGIMRNIKEPGSMIYDNLMIQSNLIEAARKSGVKLIVFLGSSCIYPAMTETGVLSGALRESDLMGGRLEPTNEHYAIAKIAGIKMLEAYQKQYGMEYLAVMPCNLYGPGDNYDPENSHFIAGMIRRFHEAKQDGAETVTLWGAGTPRREIMHVDDCAEIIVELVRKKARGLINIGPGVDETIARYAEMVRMIVGYNGRIIWDHSKPDGVMRKLLDVREMRGYGVAPKRDAWTGIRDAYEAFLKNRAAHA